MAWDMGQCSEEGSLLRARLLGLQHKLAWQGELVASALPAGCLHLP